MDNNDNSQKTLEAWDNYFKDGNPEYKEEKSTFDWDGYFKDGYDESHGLNSTNNEKVTNQEKQIEKINVEKSAFDWDGYFKDGYDESHGLVGDKSKQETNKEENTTKQDINNNSDIKKKKQKLIVGIILGLVLLSVGLYFLISYFTNREVNMTKSKSVLKEYLNTSINSNYKESYQYVYFPKNSFYTLDDYLYYVDKNAYFEKLNGSSISSIKLNEENDNTSKYTVKLKDKESNEYNLDIELLMDSNNEWKVVSTDTYIKNWKVEVPSNSKLYINNILVDSSLVTDTNDNHDIYTISAISSSKKTFKIVTNFKEEIRDIEVAGSNSGMSIIPILDNEEELNKTLNFIKESWNDLYENYSNNTLNDEVLNKYLDSNIDSKKITEYFDSLTRKGNNNSTNKYIVLDSIILNKDKTNTIDGLDIVTINFGYKVKFTVDYVSSSASDQKEYMTRYSTIKLIKTNDTYKIYEISDEKLFSYLKENIKEYK